ncbi:MAG: hypothetical protein M3Z04_13630, partial [Chloroflexota bacterium]|nr:hypothetical protein [Chloroflexota bacterium]
MTPLHRCGPLAPRLGRCAGALAAVGLVAWVLRGASLGGPPDPPAPPRVAPSPTRLQLPPA